MLINGVEYTIEPNADLSGANLHSANLRGANLRGADLCGAVIYNGWIIASARE